MVSVFLAVQTLLVVQGQGWFANWLSILDTARVWLANGREGAGLARAVRLVWEEEQEEIGRISRELYWDFALSDWDVDWLVVRLIAEEDRSRGELGYPSSAPVLAPAARAESGHAPSPRELPGSAPSSGVRAEEEEVRRKRWRPSIQLAQAAEEEVRAERRKKQNVLRLARDGLSVEVGSESSGRMEDVEFRLQKDGWLLISRFFEEQLGPQAFGLVKSMTQ